jgi:cytochrome c-type biogenesis protein
MDLLREWYVILSQLSGALAGPLGELATRAQLPVASPLVFGLVGAVAPCQLTTNLSAMAYLGREGTREAAAREAGAFLLGKALVYTALGGLALAAGAGLQQAAIPVAVATRRALGPVLLLIGIAMVGGFRLRGGFGTRLALRLGAFLPRSGSRRAFAMGGMFALAFCPTLFWLFFGLTLPLGLQTPLGFVFPALFAVGTSAPVLVVGGLLAVGAPATAAEARLRRASTILTRLAGVVFLIAGVNDTLTYWAL